MIRKKYQSLNEITLIGAFFVSFIFCTFGKTFFMIKEAFAKSIIYILFVFYNILGVFKTETKPSLVYFTNSEHLRKSIEYFIGIGVNLIVLLIFSWIVAIITTTLMFITAIIVFTFRLRRIKKSL